MFAKRISRLFAREISKGKRGEKKPENQNLTDNFNIIIKFNK